MGKNKYYEQGYSYILRDEELKDWDYSYSIHKNANGTHFDLRLYCPMGSDAVYSWSSQTHLLSKAEPVKIRRVRDHQMAWMSFEGMYTSAKGVKNTIKLIEHGPANLVSLLPDGFIFSVESRIFRLRHIKGKKYLYIPIAGLVK